MDWVTELLQYMWAHGKVRAEPTAEATQAWTDEVREMYEMVLMRKAQGWFTGYNSNVAGHEKGTMRYLVYNGGTPKYRRKIAEVAAADYAGIELR